MKPHHHHCNHPTIYIAKVMVQYQFLLFNQDTSINAKRSIPNHRKIRDTTRNEIETYIFKMMQQQIQQKLILKPITIPIRSTPTSHFIA
jgi:hypothetical protein